MSLQVNGKVVYTNPPCKELGCLYMAFPSFIYTNITNCYINIDNTVPIGCMYGHHNPLLGGSRFV